MGDAFYRARRNIDAAREDLELSARRREFDEDMREVVINRWKIENLELDVSKAKAKAEQEIGGALKKLVEDAKGEVFSLERAAKQQRKKILQEISKCDQRISEAEQRIEAHRNIVAQNVPACDISHVGDIETLQQKVNSMKQKLQQAKAPAAPKSLFKLSLQDIAKLPSPARS